MSFSSSGSRSYRFLSIGSPGWILFCTPSSPAISIAAKARYALQVGSGKRTSTGRGPVARRIGEIDRGFDSRHQTLVRVRARIGDRIERAGVLDDAPDVIQRKFGQARIAVAREQVLPVLPDR